MTHIDWEEIKERNRYPLVTDEKPFRERKPLLLILSSLFLIFTFLMTYSFSNDPPKLPVILFLAVFAVISAGFLCATIFPRPSHWAYKFIALVVFLTYLYYLIDQVIISKVHFWPTGPLDSDSASESFFGFLLIGIPAFIYLFFSKSLNRLEEGDVEKITLIDFYVAKLIQSLRRPLMAISVFLHILAFFKLLKIINF
ncbi:MAG: hypothetical protein R3F48_07655 [Candidatus Zixiibacteriota bacterium]